MTASEEDTPTRDIYSISRLNAEVRSVLEQSFPLVWVEGEISNLARPASGHIYFSLKDPQAQVRCAMFRMKRQRLRFQPENGQQVLVRARISLYEGRGEYQLIVEHMEPAGEGALQQAFERLKQQLAAEGLFDTARKRPLPMFPRRVGLITSPTGAAIRDVLTVMRRRFPGIPVTVYPIPVQGSEAPAAISRMIGIADERGEADVLILTRGGGSLEDLAAFNDEGVARAIYGCNTPVVSAVGHEIDFTIADFVADRRAPTPSAAAEMVTPDAVELSQRLSSLAGRLSHHTRQHLGFRSSQLGHLRARLAQWHPGARLGQQQQRLDELAARLDTAVGDRLAEEKRRCRDLRARLGLQNPGSTLPRLIEQVQQFGRRLAYSADAQFRYRRQRLASLAGQINAMSPLAVLDRGYSITRLAVSGEIVRGVSRVHSGDRLETRVGGGIILSRVEETIESDK